MCSVCLQLDYFFTLYVHKTPYSPYIALLRVQSYAIDNRL